MPCDRMIRFFETLESECFMVTYGDVKLRSQHSDVSPTKADVRSKLTRNIALSIPIVASPMDTVTESAMAIAMAEAGGAGSIHKNFLTVEEQAKHVNRTKFRLNGRIKTPKTVGPDDTVGNVLAMIAEKRYQFRTFPVVTEGARAVGLVSGSDFDFCDDLSLPIRAIMTPIESLSTGRDDTTKEQAYATMCREKKKVLLLLESEAVVGMYTHPDLKRILNNSDHSYNTIDDQLVVGVAIGSGAGALSRAEVLVHSNPTYWDIDTAHADTPDVIETVRALKRLYPHIDVLAGNISSGGAAQRLADAGVDGVKVGQGPGSICTTQVVAGIGAPQVSAIWEVARALDGSNVPICADGGITYSGDIVKALAAGADCVMIGGLLAGTDEAPGETFLYDGRLYKEYRGMGSEGAMRQFQQSRERYGQLSSSGGKSVPEGVEGVAPYKGPIAGVLHQLVGGIKSGMGYQGCGTITELHERAFFIRHSAAGSHEAHPRVAMTKDPPNYR